MQRRKQNGAKATEDVVREKEKIAKNEYDEARDEVNGNDDNEYGVNGFKEGAGGSAENDAKNRRFEWRKR